MRKRPGRPPKDNARALAETIAKNGLDQRTGVARLLRQTEADLANDAGGMEHLSAREQLLVRRTAALAVIVSSIEGYVFNQKTLLTKDGTLLPALGTHYLSFQNTLRLNLLALSLKPDKPTTDDDLDVYLKQKRTQPQEAAE